MPDSLNPRGTGPRQAALGAANENAMTNATIALKDRSKRFALDIIRPFRSLPRAEDVRIIGRQLLRAGTSVAADYRAVCRARSRAEFIAKMGTVVEEADETVFW
jgi:hypothetical protein